MDRRAFGFIPLAFLGLFSSSAAAIETGPNPNQSCQLCKYFKAGARGANGHCLRFPAPVEKNHAEWCGEFSKKTGQ